jgi:quercetin dioxygenase-like cupin family protein
MTTATTAVHHRWSDIPAEPIGNLVERRFFTGERMTVARLDLKPAGATRTHTHESEEVLCVLTGSLKVTVEGETFVVGQGEVIEIHGGVPHLIEALEDTSLIGVFSPIRKDWLDKTDTYFYR